MPSPSRRALLGALATLPLSACLGSDGPGTPTSEPPTDDPTTDRTATTSTVTPSEPAIREPGEPYETEDITVTVSGLAVRHGMVRFGTVHADPVWKDGAQFILATVTVEGDGDSADLDVTATADTLDGRPERHYAFVPGTPDTDQRLGFAVPIDPAPAEAAVVWRGPREVRWPVPDGLVTDLGRVPDFSLEGVDVPDAARDGASLDVTLEVANDGARDGRFLAELGDAALSDQPEVEVPVPAGETVTATRTMEARFGGDEMTVVLRWEGGEVYRDVKRA